MQAVLYESASAQALDIIQLLKLPCHEQVQLLSQCSALVLVMHFAMAGGPRVGLGKPWPCGGSLRLGRGLARGERANNTYRFRQLPG